MSNVQENRVLGRLGARLLTDQELQQIAGGFITANCTIAFPSGLRDGDCHVPPA